MRRTGDPLYDFHQHDAEAEEWLEKQPACVLCLEKIQDEKCLVINDEPMHIACAEEEFGVWTSELTR